MPRTRDHLGIFLSKTPSSCQVGTNNKEEKREGIEVEVQISFWNNIYFPEGNNTPESLGIQSTERTMAEEEEHQFINEFPIKDSQ